MNEATTYNKIEKGIHLSSLPRQRYSLMDIDWSAIKHGDSVLVENERRAGSVVSSFKHFKKRNPEKLIDIQVSWRKVSKSSEDRRVFFIKKL